MHDEHSISAIGMAGMTILAPDISEMMDLQHLNNVIKGAQGDPTNKKTIFFQKIVEQFKTPILVFDAKCLEKILQNSK